MEIINRNCDIDDEMPSDISFQILIWLPVKSLLRFKSVCKSWCSLIESSEFIMQHRIVYHHRHVTSFKQGNGNLFHVPICFTWDGHIGCPGLLSVDKFEKLDLPITHDPFKFHPITTVAYCDGIICLLQNRTVCLWNPATKQSTNLPPLPVPPVRLSFGLGFDANTNDYKVVCLNLCLYIKCIIYVCSVSSDYWRIITDSVLPEMLISDYPKTTHHNEICWWLGTILSGESDGSSTLFWFNFTEEVFGTRKLPESTGEIISYSKLALLRGNISCICKVRGNPVGRTQSWCLEIWMLTDFSVSESWIKLYAIGPFLESERWECLAGFSKNGDFVVYKEFLGTQPYLYDLSTQETVSFSTQVCFCHFEVILYEENLISVRRGNGAANRVTCSDHNARVSINGLMASSSNICCEINMPESVVFHILLRLPVMSLLRFKSVCKSWLSIINKSNFISQHLHHHQTDNGSQKLIFLSKQVPQLFEDLSHPTPNVSCACSLSANKFELLDFPFCEGWDYDSMEIVASCNGVICLRREVGDRYKVYLWNPATKQFREISDVSEHGHLFFGFGFDIKSNDYKLVCFDGPKYGSGIHVYNLSYESWKIIDDDGVWPTVSCVTFRSGLKTPYRNSIHCSVGSVDPVNCTQTILSFDFSTEVLKTIPLPTSIATGNGSSNWLQLTICRENICCICSTYILENENTHVEVWMMNEYAVKESWTKLYTLGDFSLGWYPIIWSSKIGESILMLKDGQLCLCDLVSRETKSLSVQVGLQKWEFDMFSRGDFEVVMYEESLVSISRGNHA